MEKEIIVLIGDCKFRLSTYKEWEELQEELKDRGLENSPIKHIEGLDIYCEDITIEELYTILKNSEVLDYEDKYMTMVAYVEAKGWEEFKNLVEECFEEWNENIILYPQDTIEEAFDEVLREVCGDKDKKVHWLFRHITIDYSGENIYKTSNGILIIDN